VATRTVRLDDEAERALQEIVQATGLSKSAALKKGLLLLRDEVVQYTQRDPYDIYRQLDLGPGGYAISPSSQTRHGVQEALKKKLRR